MKALSKQRIVTVAAGMLLAALFLFLRSDSLKAYSNSCTDFQLTGALDGPDNGTHGVSVAIYRSVGVASGNTVFSGMSYGDGSNDSGLTGSGFAQRTAHHTYASAGDYTVFATYRGLDQFGAWDTCDDSYVIHIQ